MRLTFAAQGAVRNHRLKNHSRETMRLFIKDNWKPVDEFVYAA
jgi:hypothetical protein